MRLQFKTDLIFPVSMLGTYLFLPLVYITLLSSPLFSVDSTPRETAATLVILVLLIHIYTFGIGYLIHTAIKRRKLYQELMNGKGEGLPMWNLSSEDVSEDSKCRAGLMGRRKSQEIDHDNNRDGEGSPMYNPPRSPRSPYWL